MAVVLPFTTPHKKGWSSAEHAEFVRATAILRGSGLPVAVESGVSDEGDPWTIFLREDTGDVIVHIAKIDGLVVAASAASDDVVSGPSFRSVVDRIIRHQPLVLPTTRSSDKVFMHPTAVITAFVATALVWSYNDDASAYRNDVTLEDDRITARAETVKAGGAAVLREGLLLKSEVAQLGLDSSGAALSNRFVLAAGLAAIAVALELTRLDSQEASSTSVAQFNNDHQLDDTLHQAVLTPTSALPAFDVPVDTAAALNQSDASLLSQDEHLIFAAVSKESGGDAAAPPSAALVHQTVEQAITDLGHTDSPSYLYLEGGSSLRLGVLVGSEVVNEHRDAESPGTVSVTNSKTSGSPPPTAEVPVAVAAAPPPTIHAKSLATDISDFVSHVIGAKDFPDANSLLLAKQIESAADGANPLQGHATSIGADVGPAKPDPAASSAPNSDHAQAASASDGGYRIFDDILAFASDPTHQIATSLSTLQSVVSALDANPFLPAWERILIIDLPDLRADAFKFTDDILMVSQDLASHLLPDTQMQAQVELGLVNGTTLKLIGVIDLHPDQVAPV